MATDAEPITEDGPLAPDGFVWRGDLYTGLRPTGYRLLANLWIGRNRTRQITWLCEVFELDGPPERHQYAPAASRVNSWFAWHGLPFKIRKHGDYLQVIQLPE